MSAPTAAVDEETSALRHFLDYQRSAVPGVLEGLDEEAWHRGHLDIAREMADGGRNLGGR